MTFRMIRNALRIAVAILGVVPAIAESQTVVLDFDSVPSGPVASPYVEDGFVLELVPDPRCVFPTLAYYQFRDGLTGSVSLYAEVVVLNTQQLCGEWVSTPYKTAVRRVDGGEFDLFSIDGACLSVEGCGESFRIRGTISDGRVVEQWCVFEATAPVVSTCNLDERFRSLVQVEWLEPMRADEVIFDNISLGVVISSPKPWIVWSPELVDFGQAVVNGYKELSVEMGNRGDAALEIYSVSAIDPVSPPFTVSIDTCIGVSLAAGETCEIRVAFSPMFAGDFVDAFSVESNDPYAPSIQIYLRATAVIAGGQVLGLESVVVTCENKTQKVKLDFPLSDAEDGLWDCQTAGLPVMSGDEVTMKVRGTAK